MITNIFEKQRKKGSKRFLLGNQFLQSLTFFPISIPKTHHNRNLIFTPIYCVHFLAHFFRISFHPKLWRKKNKDFVLFSFPLLQFTLPQITFFESNFRHLDSNYKNMWWSTDAGNELRILQFLFDFLLVQNGLQCRSKMPISYEGYFQ